MDLPTCPACGQSVIDDDATACPFCGASLSDKPGSAGSRPSAPAPQAESKQQISKRAAGPTETDDDNPFGAVPTAAQTAIHATRKPARGCLLKVVCPMCETTGFVPGKAAGRDVRCANPQCLMPVFTAPKAESEATSQADAQPEPAAPSPAPVGLYIGAAVVTVIVGGCIWAYFLSGTRQVDQATFNLPPPIEPSSDPFDVTAETSANADAHGPSDTVEPGATPTFVAADIIKAAPQEMIVQARSGETRDKAWCRRLIADAFARIGQTKQARAELDHLLKIAPESGYYRVDPLVTMAWQELAAGDVESARSIANEASSLAENLPNIGPRPLSTAAGLAARRAAANNSSKTTAATCRSNATVTKNNSRP